MERIELEHVYCEGGMVAGESKLRGRTGRIERTWIQEAEEEKGCGLGDRKDGAGARMLRGGSGCGQK